MLIFIQIFLLMGLYSLVNTSLVVKLTHHSFDRKTYLTKAIYFQKHLEVSLNLKTNHCGIPVMNSSLLASASVLWWRQHTCSGKFDGIRYYYAIESLGKDACGVIRKINDKLTVIANYYRLTLMVLPIKAYGPKIILQSTLVKGSEEIFSCTNQVHSVKLGHQGGRELF